MKEKIKKIFTSIGVFLLVFYGLGIIAGAITAVILRVGIENIEYSTGSAINLYFLVAGIIVAIWYYKKK